MKILEKIKESPYLKKINENRYFKKIKENLYLIIPSACVTFWAIYYFLKIGHWVPWDRYLDFGFFYDAGQQFLTDPSKIYEISEFYYLPIAAVFFAFTISPFPLYVSFYTFYILNIIMGILIVIEFNKILKLLNFEKKYIRFLFLFLISNGWFLHRVFTFSQTKLIVGYIIVFILRREIEYRVFEKEKTLRFYFVNYFLLFFAISMALPLIFMAFIFISNDIHLKEIFKKSNVRIYLLIVTILLLQNILFIIYPSLIFDFLGQSGIEWSLKHRSVANSAFYLIGLPEDFFTKLLNSSTIILVIITCLLIIDKKLSLELKIGYFSLSSLFFGYFSGFMLGQMNLMLSLLLYVPLLKKEDRFIDLIKNNKLILISILFYLGIIFILPIETINKYLPITMEFPLNLIFRLRYVILFCGYGIMTVIILFIHYKDIENFAFAILIIIYEFIVLVCTTQLFLTTPGFI